MAHVSRGMINAARRGGFGIGKPYLETAVRALANGAEAVPVSGGEGSSPSSPTTESSRRRPRDIFPSLFSPFGQSTSLVQMMDTMDRFFNSTFGRAGPLQTALRDVSTRMPWDVMEDDKGFKLRVDMPGMPKEKVKLSVEEEDLVLRAEHEADDEGDDWSSRSYGSYNLRIQLPSNVDLSGIKAEMRDGVLKVQAPKVEGKKENQTVKIE